MTSLPVMCSTGRLSARAQIADRDFVYSRQELKNRLFETVLAAFVERYRKDGFTRSDLAVAMGRDAAQVTRWLKGPANWQVETVSDIMHALRAELVVSFVLLEDKRDLLDDLTMVEEAHPPVDLGDAMDRANGYAALAARFKMALEAIVAIDSYDGYVPKKIAKQALEVTGGASCQ